MNSSTGEPGSHLSGRLAVSEPRRDEIMTAAKKVFARNGFHATTIADVANEARLPFDAVYQYFDSKDALFHALITAQEYALRTHVAVALAQSGAQFGYAEARFRATLRATFEFFEADKATTKLLFRDAYQLDKQFDKRLGGIYERFIDDIETLIVAAQKRGDVVAAPPVGGLHLDGADRSSRAAAADHRGRHHRGPGPRTSSSRW
ncbi:MAG: TetR/AcrR family transcriptional regulator [Mycobacterium sp.]|uniref:TetR/AcrR family transcriptional regulator n=1 Tax=Mycobacterium sp. TaxID=1785 RepID=UPI003C795D40